MGAAAERKQRGAWYTPDDLVARVVAEVVTGEFVARCGAEGRRPIRIVDPACGDGRFLLAAANRVVQLGGAFDVVGVDIDEGAAAATQSSLAALMDGSEFAPRCSATVVHGDALATDWSASADHEPHFDLVIGNPPFLSQMAAATTRGGSSRRGGGPYADAAVEFLALGAELVAPTGGRVAFVLPQSLLSARDAGAVRTTYDDRASLFWSWWTGKRVFDAQVLTCALAFEFGCAPADRSGRPMSASASSSASSWTHVVTSRRGVPDVPSVIDRQGAGTLGDRARLNANFRDEYYGMVPAVGDHSSGPKLITSGLIDPGRSLWGHRPITFAKQRFERPRIDLAALTGKMPRWAADRLVPKVLIANQTKIIEAVADPSGDTLPGVPVVTAYPFAEIDGVAADQASNAWQIAAVLTSPVASAWAWHRSAGTGLSADAIRLGPVLLADLPWPNGDLDPAVAALKDGDIRACASAVHDAFGLAVGGDDSENLTAWWTVALDRIESRT